MENTVRIILCCLIGLIGFVWVIGSTVMNGDRYVYYTWNNLSGDELALIEEELKVRFPDDMVVDKLETHASFVPDMPHSVALYYISGDGDDFADRMESDVLTVRVDGQEQCLTLFYYGKHDYQLHQLVMKYGVEHRERLIYFSLMEMGIVLLLMTLCFLPYEKLYRKLNGL